MRKEPHACGGKSIRQGEQPEQSPEEDRAKGMSNGDEVIKVKGSGHTGLAATGKTLSWEVIEGLGGGGRGPGVVLRTLWGRVRGQWDRKALQGDTGQWRPEVVEYRTWFEGLPARWMCP